MTTMTADGLVVNVHEAKTNLSKLLARVENGETIMIARAGKPIAELTPISPTAGVVFGALKGLMWSDDPDIFGENDTEIADMLVDDDWEKDL